MWGGGPRAGGRDGLSASVSPTGGKKKPLKQPKKQAKEMDEVSADAQTGGGGGWETRLS